MRSVVALLAASVLLAGCSGGNGGAGDGGTNGGSSSGTDTTSQGILPQPDEVPHTVRAIGAYPVNPAFDPETLSVPAGAVVHMTFENDDTTPQVQHNWVVAGIPNATSANIGPGQTDQFDFTAPTAAGSFDYYCSIGDHRSRGMEGTLTVTVS